MYYTIYHLTRFRYTNAITESVMELHIQPRSDNFQRCLDFRLSTSPKSQILHYRGDYGNRVHHFDVPNKHNHLTITAEALVEVITPPELPARLSPQSWQELDALTSSDEYWDMLHPSRYVKPGELLHEFMHTYNLRRRDDPLTVLRDISTAIYTYFEYAKQNTRVDSPIDDALRIKRGVCQDFAHIMIAVARELGIPCRYVSGYLCYLSGSNPNERASAGATHAWVEALLPDLGWIGFDPTSNKPVAGKHIRVAVGRDYADVPPTHGIFRGKAESELAVVVRVNPTDQAPAAELQPELSWLPAMQESLDYEETNGQQQQQQQ